MTQNNSLVSTAIIAYNQEDLLPETLNSVIAQDYADVEIIVSDDCSTDHTVQVAHDILGPSGRPFKVLAGSTNSGITANTNRAFAAANGGFIAYLGGDDLWDSQKIGVTVTALRNHPHCSFVCHGMRLIDETGRETGRTHQPVAGAPEVVNPADLCSGNVNYYGSSQVIRNDRHTVAMDTRLKWAADLVFGTQLALERGPCLALPDLLGSYRVSRRGVTLSKAKAIAEDGLIGLAVLQSEAPELSPQIRKRWSKIVYSQAVQSYSSGDLRKARGAFGSLCASSLAPKALVRYMQAQWQIKNR